MQYDSDIGDLNCMHSRIGRGRGLHAKDSLTRCFADLQRAQKRLSSFTAVELELDM